MTDENDDFYKEEGEWRNPITHRHILTDKIIELRYALNLAMARLEAAKAMGVDMISAQFQEIVDKALEWDDEA